MSFEILTEPGQSTTPIFVKHFRNKQYSAIVSDIDTYLCLKVQTSFDLVTWHDLEDKYTIRENGLYNFVIDSSLNCDYLRLGMCEEYGGTNVQVKVYFLGAN